MPTTPPSTVDAYIATFPPIVRRRLDEIRTAVRHAAPDASESISYRIAAYAWHGSLVYFAGFTGHVGLYPITTKVRSALGAQLAPFVAKGAKATLRFPLDRPVPRVLIRRIVKVRMHENEERALTRRQPAKRPGHAK